MQESIAVTDGTGVMLNILPVVTHTTKGTVIKGKPRLFADTGRGPIVGFGGNAGCQSKRRIDTTENRGTALAASVDEALEFVDGWQTPITVTGITGAGYIETLDKLGIGSTVKIPGSLFTVRIGGPGIEVVLVMDAAIIGFLLPLQPRRPVDDGFALIDEALADTPVQQDSIDPDLGHTTDVQEIRTRWRAFG